MAFSEMMKAIIIYLMLFGTLMALPIQVSAERDPRFPKQNEVLIDFMGLEVPLDTILLIRKDEQYCALRFTNAWTEIDTKERKKQSRTIKQGGPVAEAAIDMTLKKYASYETFYADGLADFTGKNIQSKKMTASWLPLKGPFHPFIYQPGNNFVECGPFKQHWEYLSYVSFVPRGVPGQNRERDHGIELAATIWTDINKVKIKDPRIKWYRFDETRKPTYIPIDKLWADEPMGAHDKKGRR